ncbi:recombinase family protein [Clostridium sp. CM027]|uniref:recombinase family protein n=1 Tax=Clostridium sp. CM027 TaxID=2849865 RepID=UPI001C6E8914|nr:recombinase family protein [Clostridium sp. CM027]MBW9144160.1 recombinase family protein [Clostridium sp. CM027]UVE41197.1 recombinase family protein [Clostridium sp. CM027]
MKIAAIYSRKSKITGKGESIINQIELCKHECNHLEIEKFIIYEDEGFSGKNIKRPQFQKMLIDAREKKFHVLICYRLDRISRNISDFTTLINELDSLHISFISVNEQFDTSTPMGRAMMYIASVFAQLERETIGERVRDNMLELAKSGRWLGGQTPLGYESRKLSYLDGDFREKSMYTLSPIKKELDVVKIIYDKYLQYKSISQVFIFIFKKNIKTKNGADFNKKRIQLILRNPLYVRANEAVMNHLQLIGMNVMGKANDKQGIITYNKSKGARIKRDITEWIAAISKHEGIIDAFNWLKVQQILDDNKNKAPRLGTSAAALLTGILKCSKCGKSMIVKHGHISATTNKKIQYYVCSTKDYSKGERCNNPNVRVDELEKVVIDNLKNITISRNILLEELNKIKCELSKTNLVQSEIESLSSQINIKQDQIDILVNQLSLDNEISKYIRPQIYKLGIELEKLSVKYKDLASTSYKFKNNNPIVDKFLNSSNSFSSIMDILDFNNKRLLINNIVNSIYWDGARGIVKIKTLN